MYTAFYGLYEKPFSLSPDPRYLFFSNGHREALAHLRYGIEEGEGFIAVTGEVGTGKSTLCRALIGGFGPETEVALLFNPPRSATELLQSIAQEFGLEPAGHQRHALNDQLNRFLLDRKKLGKRVLLIIDEAQNLDAHVLEEIRLLSNLETASSKLIQIVLLGQPELDRKLDSNELRQLRQRISVRWFLTPLSRAEAVAYIAHRLEVAAGGRREIFTAAALKEIYRRTDGVPRRINLLADRSLLAGYGAGANEIGPTLVRQAAGEIEGVGGTPNRRRQLLLQSVLALALFVLSGALGNQAGQSSFVHRWLARDAVTPLLIGPVDAMPGDLSLEIETALFDLETAPDPGEPSLDLLRGIKSVQAGPVGTRGERLRNTLQPGAFLGRLLDHQDADVARHVALNVILESFGYTPAAETPLDFEAAVMHLQASGLFVLRVDDASLDTLRALNHPVMLTLLTEQGAERTIAMRSLGDTFASLHGVVSGEGLEVAVGEIDSLWNGEALIVWAPLEPIPDVLRLGHEGQEVVWLQQALRELGLYSGAPSGRFDASTARSVRVLQADALIEPSGDVGPRTQMVLYSKLPRYSVPRLQVIGGAG